MDSEYKAICVVGCGSVGLPLAIALAERGFCVEGYDTDFAHVERLSGGNHCRVEIDVAVALSQARTSGRLHFVSRLQGDAGRRCFIVTVGTPAIDGHFDDAQLAEACAALARVARSDDLVILRSTVPIGTTRRMAKTLAAGGLNLQFAYSPDRMLQGSGYADQFAVPNVVAGMDEAARIGAVSILSRLGPTHEVETLEAAEAVKLFANVSRDVEFALANEFALICESLGIDFYAVRAAGSKGYPRLRLARPGPVGGQCLSKDAWLLASSVASEIDQPLIALTARAVNESILDRLAANINSELAKSTRGRPKVAFLGIAFKGVPSTIDTRGSFALALSDRLRERWPGILLSAWDPEIVPADLTALGFDASDNMPAVVKGADLVVLANDHPKLIDLDWARLATQMRTPARIYDLCGVSVGRIPDLPQDVHWSIFGGIRTDAAQSVDRPT